MISNTGNPVAVETKPNISEKGAIVGYAKIVKIM
jgi:hypothetical protein